VERYPSSWKPDEDSAEEVDEQLIAAEEPAIEIEEHLTAGAAVSSGACR
jgi:hypothetical protein